MARRITIIDFVAHERLFCAPQSCFWLVHAHQKPSWPSAILSKDRKLRTAERCPLASTKVFSTASRTSKSTVSLWRLLPGAHGLGQFVCSYGNKTGLFHAAAGRSNPVGNPPVLLSKVSLKLGEDCGINKLALILTIV